MSRLSLSLIAACLAFEGARAANPITTALYTADPCAISFNDTLWIFTGHDENVASTGFIMNDWYLFSTADLSTYKNWGSQLRANSFPWAIGAAFASHVVERGGKFYWYVSAIHRSIKVKEGFAIGVAVANHPKGPWTPVAAPLVTDLTPNAIDLNIDPAVYVDLDGTAWLYWGSWGAARRVKLKSNMTETEGAVETVVSTGFFEAPWVHRFDGNYYLSYASGYPSTTNYAMSSKLAGPWVSKGVINTKMAKSETNHQAIVRHRGHWLFVYHTGDAPGGHTYHRSVSVEDLYYDTDGTIKPILRTSTGPKRIDATPIPDGSFRLLAKHSGMALQDSGGKIVQMRKSSSDSQVWRIEQMGKGRTYSLRNAATGRYLAFPSAERLTKAQSVVGATGIVMENASVEDGYMLFADSSKDHVGDILDLSTDPGKELVVWRRSGAQNQAFLLEKAVTTAIADLDPPARDAMVLSASARDGIRFSSPTEWTLRAPSGSVLGRGVSVHATVAGMGVGLVLLESGGRTRRLLLR